MKLKHTQGFSLLEVMIAVFVLALGVIGAAGLQLAAVRTTQQSGFQSVAVALASELADKMRSSDAVMKGGDATNPFLAVNYNSLTDPLPTAPGMCFTSAASCDANSLAKAEIYEWLIRVKELLPGGRVLVCRDSVPYDSAKKALTWTCTADSSSGMTIKIGWKSKNPDGSFIDSNGVIPPGVAITVESYVK
jgi:type IV pilus assembly protein PilV